MFKMIGGRELDNALGQAHREALVSGGYYTMVDGKPVDPNGIVYGENHPLMKRAVVILRKRELLVHKNT